MCKLVDLSVKKKILPPSILTLVVLQTILFGVKYRLARFHEKLEDIEGILPPPHKEVLRATDKCTG